jgi:hypothetical protein
VAVRNLPPLIWMDLMAIIATLLVSVYLDDFLFRMFFIVISLCRNVWFWCLWLYYISHYRLFG